MLSFATTDSSTSKPIVPAPLGPSLRKSIQLGERVAEMLAQNATTVPSSTPEAVELDPPTSSRASFRRLAGSEFSPYAASSLWRAYRIYCLAQQFPELHAYTHIGVAHASVALGLPLPQRIEYLRAAEQLRWSRRYLEAQVRLLRAAQRARESTP